MRYYAQYENNKLIAIGTGYGGIEITESEYNTLLSEIREKASLVDQLYNEEITLSDVPEEWQEEIQRRVNEYIEMMGKMEEQPDSTNGYIAGDKVTHNGSTWISDVDNNVWEPGVYGWSLVE